MYYNYSWNPHPGWKIVLGPSMFTFPLYRIKETILSFTLSSSEIYRSKESCHNPLSQLQATRTPRHAGVKGQWPLRDARLHEVSLVITGDLCKLELRSQHSHDWRGAAHFWAGNSPVSPGQGWLAGPHTGMWITASEGNRLTLLHTPGRSVKTHSKSNSVF